MNKAVEQLNLSIKENNLHKELEELINKVGADQVIKNIIKAIKKETVLC